MVAWRITSIPMRPVGELDGRHSAGILGNLEIHLIVMSKDGPPGRSASLA